MLKSAVHGGPALADDSDPQTISDVYWALCRSRVLTALQDILQFDSDPALRSLARRRFLELAERFPE